MTEDKDMADTTAVQDTGEKKPLSRFLPLVVIGVVAVLGFVFLRDYLSFDALKENREALLAWRDDNYLIAALTYVGIYIVVVGFSLPGGLVMTLTGGFLFGLVAGTLLTLVGATAGATCIFLAARAGLGDSLRERAGPWMKKFESQFKENQLSFLFFLRLVPAMPFVIANVLPAFFGVSLFTYIWTTFLGIFPGTAVFTSVGTGLGEIFDSGGSIGDATSDPYVWGPLLALSILSLLPIIIKKVRGKPAVAGEDADV